MEKVIGYTQGTFDMFHIGHLNLIKNAKRHCDYLIVGVNADDLVESYKHKRPIIPLEERAEIVRAIKYVDEVIVTTTLDKKKVWEKIRFNEIYIGDDWKGNERWEKTGKEMEALGAKLVYLPYTKDTSSTMLREKLKEFGEKYGVKQLLVIPSSIHEMLISPYTDWMEMDQMKAMVREVNEKEVLPEERLTDQAYIMTL